MSFCHDSDLVDAVAISSILRGELEFEFVGQHLFRILPGVKAVATPVTASAADDVIGVLGLEGSHNLCL